jgi:thiol-disulfide isomerase/thioredoxin
MNRPSLVTSTFCILLLLGVGCARQKEMETPPPKVTGVADLPLLGLAPAWQMKDLSGNVVSSEQFKGKIVIVDFWATWCGPCKMEIPGYIEMTKKYGAEGLVIVGVSVDQAGPDVVKEFVAKNGMNYPVVMFDENVMAAFGGIEAIPTTFLIDRAGQVRNRKVGAEPTAEYEAKVLALLK